jgi:demethylmenaquinone methyltransferase/2-methoxy-6-polyprenyl-1,4-benzoquinol methylase
LDVGEACGKDADPPPSTPREPGAGIAATRRLFNETASAYDRFNRIFSFGSGAWYRRRCLRRAGLRPGMRVLDVAIGTGLVAREAARLAGSQGRIIGIDLSEAMLEEARPLGIPLIQGAAEALPFADSSIDFLTVGYALRHIPDLPRMLDEFRRVLRPDGTLLILELRRPRYGLTRRIVAQHFRRLVPLLCANATDSDRLRRLMDYHWQTVEENMSPDEVVDTLRDAGFTGIRREIYFDLFCSYAAQSGGEASRPAAAATACSPRSGR